ncbi:WD40-repeat-containing domain protein [Trichoderma chlorosporum]
MEVPWIISGSADGTIKIWDRSTSQCISTLEGHSNTVNYVAYLATGKCILTFNDHVGDVRVVAWSPDGTRLASSDSSSVRIWDSATGQCALILEGHRNLVNSVTWSSDGAQITSASTTGQCLLTLEGHGDQVLSVVTSPDSLRLASASIDSKIKIWDEATGKCTSTLEEHSDAINSISWSPDLLRLASASNDKTIKIWNTSSGQCTLALEDHKDGVTAVSWSPDAAFLVSASFDNTIKTWDPVTAQCISTLTGHSSYIKSVILVAKIGDGSITQYESLLQHTTLEGHGGGVTGVVWSPDGKYLASVSGDQTGKIWDSTTWLCKLTLQPGGYIEKPEWSPDSSKLASSTGSDDSIFIWDTTTGKQISKLGGESDEPVEIAWSPKSSRILSGSNKSGDLEIWDLDTGKSTSIPVEAGFASVYRLCWSPDAKFFAKMVLTGHDKSIRALSWSLDGKQIVSGSEDGSFKVWDLTTGDCKATLQEPDGLISSASWSSDGVRFASSLFFGGLKIWDAVRGECIAQLKGHTSNVFSVAWLPEIKPPSPPQPKDSDPSETLAHVKSISEQGVNAALGSIAQGLAEFNKLIEFWPDYTGNDTTNEKRKDIIKAATDYVQAGVGMVTSSGKGDGGTAKLIDIEKDLVKYKLQFAKETDAEQAALDSLQSATQKAMDEMHSCQNSYDACQGDLLAKIKGVSLGTVVQRSVSRKDNTILDLEQTGDLLYLTLEQEQNKEGGRLLAVANLISPAIEKLGTIGEPPYHRPNRHSEDALCTTILTIHRESLIDEAFSESARKAVAQVQDWFDEDIPKNTQKEPHQACTQMTDWLKFVAKRRSELDTRLGMENIVSGMLDEQENRGSKLQQLNQD